MVVSGAVSYRLRAHKLSTFFTWCGERLSWQAFCRVAQAIRPLAALVGPDVQILFVADPIAVEQLGERRALGASRMQKSTCECQATFVLWSPHDQSPG
jgi:hypothetical protein